MPFRLLEGLGSGAKKLVARVRLAARILWRGLPEPTYVDHDGVLGDVLAGKRPPGFPCPRCTARVQVDITVLMASPKVSCSECGLELTMSWNPDARARAALSRLQEATASLERARAFHR